jgi:hypothetical protein
MIGTKTIKVLDQNLERNLKKELRDQGHYLTGRLENSVESRISESSNDVSAAVTAEDYINQVNEGIAANEIDLSDVGYIQGLANYAKLRFGAKSERLAFKIAYAIARKHKQEGMPTRNSYQFSATGERTHAVEESYNNHKTENEEIIEQGIDREIDDLINKTFTDTIF